MKNRRGAWILINITKWGLLLTLASCVDLEQKSLDSPINEREVSEDHEVLVPEVSENREVSETPADLVEVGIEQGWSIVRGGFVASHQATLLVGYPGIRGRISPYMPSHKNTNFNICDHTILTYHIVEMTKQGPVEVGYKEETYFVKPTQVGHANVLISAELIPSKTTMFKDENGVSKCKDYPFPKTLNYKLTYDIVETNGSTFHLSEVCAKTPQISERTSFSFSSLPTFDDIPIHAQNWPGAEKGLTLSKEGRDISEEIYMVKDWARSADGTSVPMWNIHLLPQTVGELEFETPFGAGFTLRIAPFSETQAFVLDAKTGYKVESRIENPLALSLHEPIWFHVYNSRFKHPHCSDKTQVSLKSLTPAVCEIFEDLNHLLTEVSSMIRPLSEGECRVEASTSREIVETLTFEFSQESE